MPCNAQIVGDEEVGETEVGLELTQEIEDTDLHGHVKRQAIDAVESVTSYLVTDIKYDSSLNIRRVINKSGHPPVDDTSNPEARDGELHNAAPK